MHQSGIWSILCQLMAILGKLVDMDFKFVLPSIYINFDIQTNFKVNQTQIGHSIPKNTPKNTIMAISENPILPKCHSPKSLLLLEDVHKGRPQRGGGGGGVCQNRVGRLLYQI